MNRMQECSRNPPDNVEVETLPKTHSTVIGAHHEVELHCPESASSGMLQRMRAHSSSDAFARCRDRCHVSAVGNVRTAAELVWVWTGWPGGTTFIIFATIAITLFGPREDSAYASAKSFTIGTAIAAVFAAIAAFVLLPGQSSFIGLCAVLGLVLIPSGALSSRSWQQPLFVALGTNFVALLRPSNPAIYDPELFYNTAAALLCGVGFAMLAMRLLPAMPAETASPACSNVR